MDPVTIKIQFCRVCSKMFKWEEDDAERIPEGKRNCGSVKEILP
jgi:hypothetical protein